jgi:hypothetical protein
MKDPSGGERPGPNEQDLNPNRCKFFGQNDQIVTNQLRCNATTVRNLCIGFRCTAAGPLKPP